MKTEFKDFVYLTGKNVGNINYSDLGRFYGKQGQTLINQHNKNPKQLEAIYLGSLCQANEITKQDLIKIIKMKNIL